MARREPLPVSVSVPDSPQLRQRAEGKGAEESRKLGARS